MKILIIGNGWLGNVMADAYYSTLVDNEDMVAALLPTFDVLINAAAKTNIDFCEKNKAVCANSNIDLASRLAVLCKQTGKKYVLISSSCIFDSSDPTDIKDEKSIPNPKCFYALTKWVAEELVLEACPDSLIVRIRLPLSEKPHPRNTINKLLSYPQLNNKQESVTVIEDMLPVLRDLIEKNETGIFHLVNEGTISPAEIGTALGHTFTETTKEGQDVRLAAQGKARRVTAYVTSSRIPLLPNIRSRLPEIVAKYKSCVS